MIVTHQIDLVFLLSLSVGYSCSRIFRKRFVLPEIPTLSVRVPHTPPAPLANPESPARAATSYHMSTAATPTHQ